jgi:hypothetical protein
MADPTPSESADLERARIQLQIEQLQTRRDIVREGFSALRAVAFDAVLAVCIVVALNVARARLDAPGLLGLLGSFMAGAGGSLVISRRRPRGADRPPLPPGSSLPDGGR